MSLTLEKLRRKVRKPIGLDTQDTDLTDSEIDEYLNTSLWEISDKFPFREKEKLATFVTVAGTRNYDMPGDYDSLQKLSVIHPTTLDHRVLERVTADWYERQYDEDTWERGIPTHYVREGCLVRLWPTPDDVYTMVMRRLINIADLTETSDAPDMPRHWHEIVLYGAVWRALLDIGDVSRANHFKNHQVSLINSSVPVEAKEERDSPMAGLEVARREY